MNKSEVCKIIITELVKEYRRDQQTVHTIYDDYSPGINGLREHEVTKMIYPSIMLLADAEARSLGFEGSNIRFAIETPKTKMSFPLAAVTEPQTALSTLLPFVVDVCDRHLSKEPVLAKVFERALQTVKPDFTLDQISELKTHDVFTNPSPE